MAHASLLKTCMRQGTDARNDLRKGENVKSPPFWEKAAGTLQLARSQSSIGLDAILEQLYYKAALKRLYAAKELFNGSFVSISNLNHNVSVVRDHAQLLFSAVLMAWQVAYTFFDAARDGVFIITTVERTRNVSVFHIH